MYCRTIQDLYSDSGDSAGEYTDYENDNMVQYQAAIDVRTSLLWLSTNVDRIVELRAFYGCQKMTAILILDSFL